MAQPRLPKLDGLEGLRGLAAFVVAVAHPTFGFSPPAGDLIPPALGHTWDLVALGYWPVRAGRYAVALFFVLSGFVLARSFVATADRQVLRAAAYRRYVRLMIPCLASVLFAYALMTGGLMYNRQAGELLAAEGRLGENQHPWIEALYTQPPVLRRAVREGVWGTFFAFNGDDTYNSALWTMPLELLGSYVVFAALAIFGRGRPLWAAAAAAEFVCLTSGWPFLALFVAGMVMPDLLRRYPVRLPLAVGLPLLFASAWLGGNVDVHPVTLPFFRTVYLRTTLVQAGAAVLGVAAVATTPSLARLLGCRPLAFLGRISFGLYLVHIPLVASLVSYLYLTLRADGWSHPATLAAAYAVYLPTALLGGYLLYLVADRPAVWLSRRLSDLVARPGPGDVLRVPWAAPPDGVPLAPAAEKAA